MAEPIRNTGGNVDISLETERLAGFRGRNAGTDAERRAARHLAARLDRMGRQVEIEPIRVRPAFALAHLLHTVVAIAGSVLAVYVPVAGAALVLLAAVSAFGELTGSFYLARLLTGARASQNVVSHDEEGKPGRLILLANYDAGRDSALVRDRYRAWPTVFFWSLMVILVCAVARVFGIDATWLTVIQFVPTVVLIGLLPLFADAALSTAERARDDNAGGVATVLRLADRYGGVLDHFDVTVLLTGADQAAPLGTRAWLSRHRHELEPEATAVVAVRSGASGDTLGFGTREGLLFPTPLHPALVSILEGIEGARPYVARQPSGAAAARSAGLPAIRVSRPGSGDADSAYVYLCEVIELVDADIGPRLER
jgi:hypothetical protein